MYIVSKLSQFLQSPPTIAHWNARKGVRSYLKEIIGHGISFSPTSTKPLLSFVDADWASSPNDRCSTSGYCIYFGGSLISWSSKKQGVVAESTIEVEY